MKKVYKVNVAGIVGDWPHRIGACYTQNIIAKNKSEAIKELTCYFIKVWSINAKFNFKETIKKIILDIFDLEYIEFHKKKKC